MGPRIREDNGRGRAVPEPPLRGSRRTRRRRATTRVAPTKTGMGVGGVGKMGPRIREDNGRGRAVPEPPLRGSRRTRRRRATTRVAPTETGMGVGGVGKMGPRIREDNGRGRAVPEPPYVGVAEHDVGGNHKGCPYGDRDGSPHPRGQREGEGGSRTAP